MAREGWRLSEVRVLDLERFQERLGYRFEDLGLLELALRHASRANETPELESNERLEFLGDSVVGLAVAHGLYLAHEQWAEGDLTRGLHSLVDKNALAQLATELGLGDVIDLGRTELHTGGALKSSILANAMEAVIGAMYLDAGLVPVQLLVERSFSASFERDAPRAARDPKTELQELAMARWSALPSYSLVADSGVGGDEDRFDVAVEIASGQSATASGRSKRAAEQGAAELLLERLVADRDDEDDR